VAQEAVSQFRKHQPTLCSWIWRLPRHQRHRRPPTDLRREWPEARVLMFTTFDGEEDIYRAMQAGARGYLLKSAPREELLAAIRAVAAGERHLSPALARRLAGSRRRRMSASANARCCNSWPAAQRTRKSPAALGISEETVKRPRQ